MGRLAKAKGGWCCKTCGPWASRGRSTCIACSSHPRAVLIPARATSPASVGRSPLARRLRVGPSVAASSSPRGAKAGVAHGHRRMRSREDARQPRGRDRALRVGAHRRGSRSRPGRGRRGQRYRRGSWFCPSCGRQRRGPVRAEVSRIPSLLVILLLIDVLVSWLFGSFPCCFSSVRFLCLRYRRRGFLVVAELASSRVWPMGFLWKRLLVRKPGWAQFICGS